MTVEEFLAAGCIKKGLSPVEHFLRVKKRRDMPNMNYFVPHRSDLIETYLSTHEVVEVCAKILYQVELARATLNTMWGFSVEAELVENNEKQDELCCYVSRVEDRSVAMENGERMPYPRRLKRNSQHRSFMFKLIRAKYSACLIH